MPIERERRPLAMLEEPTPEPDRDRPDVPVLRLLPGEREIFERLALERLSKQLLVTYPRPRWRPKT